jgi:hypothetical protein
LGKQQQTIKKSENFRTTKKVVRIENIYKC